MSNLSQFFGGSAPPKLIINWFSTSGYVAVGQLLSPAHVAKQILSGAIVANTLKTVLSLTGRGEVNLLNYYVVDATSRTVRLKITIDGVVAFDSTSANIASTSFGGAAIGTVESNKITNIDKVSFNSSFLVEIASSLTESNTVTLSTLYKTY